MGMHITGPDGAVRRDEQHDQAEQEKRRQLPANIRKKTKKGMCDDTMMTNNDQ
jgi:hypothetical protein